MTVLSEGAEGPHTIALAQRYKPDVLVVDLEMWGAWLAEEMAKLRELSPKTQVIGITRIDSPKQAHELLASGASAYLGRSASLDDLLLAVRAALDPQRKSTTMTVVSREAVELSDRELQILSGAAHGLSNSEIASRLHVSEATRKALQEGWITAWDILGGEEQGQRDER